MKQDSSTERIERLLGQEGLMRLRCAKVMVIGIGGVGSNCVEALARGGVGELVIVDPDEVQRSNINRQAIAFESTVGRPKVDVMARMVNDINPDVRVVSERLHVLPDDVPGLFERHAIDYCIDCQDTIVTKLALAQYCDEHSIPFISSMGAANTFDPTQLEFADIYDTRSCPLSRSVRKQARKNGIAHMQVLYNPERPAYTEAREGAARSERSDLGTMSYMPAIMGQMLAARTICDILGIEWEQ